MQYQRHLIAYIISLEIEWKFTRNHFFLRYVVLKVNKNVRQFVRHTHNIWTFSLQSKSNEIRIKWSKNSNGWSVCWPFIAHLMRSNQIRLIPSHFYFHIHSSNLFDYWLLLRLLLFAATTPAAATAQSSFCRSRHFDSMMVLFFTHRNLLAKQSINK